MVELGGAMRLNGGSVSFLLSLALGTRLRKAYRLLNLIFRVGLASTSTSLTSAARDSGFLEPL